jgi:hypothetical protein
VKKWVTISTGLWRDNSDGRPRFVHNPRYLSDNDETARVQVFQVARRTSDCEAPLYDDRPGKRLKRRKE